MLDAGKILMEVYIGGKKENGRLQEKRGGEGQGGRDGKHTVWNLLIASENCDARVLVSSIASSVNSYAASLAITDEHTGTSL